MAESDTTDRVVAGRYRLIDQLGRGGMGAVWRARDEVLEREVAVKELITPPELTEPEREVFAIRTFREARAAGRLNHPGVAAVYDVFEESGHPWIVLELVPSRTLGSVVREDGPLPPRRVAQIGLQVLNALRAAHNAGVLHRDVKPDNVLLGEHGRAVLTDFGIATLEDESNVTRTGALIGTPAFIAPERASGGQAQPASDLWSLGVTLYFAVEGVSPFHRDTVLGTLGAVMFDEPAPPRSAGALAPLITGLIRKEPENRMTAGEAERRLHAALSGTVSLLNGGPETEPTPVVPAVVPSAGPVRRGPRKGLVAALVGGGALLVGLVAGAIAYITAVPAGTTQSVSPTITVYRTTFTSAPVSPESSVPAVEPTPAGTQPPSKRATPKKSPGKSPKESPSQADETEEGSAESGEGTIEPSSAGEGKGKKKGKSKNT